MATRNAKNAQALSAFLEWCAAEGVWIDPRLRIARCSRGSGRGELGDGDGSEGEGASGSGSEGEGVGVYYEGGEEGVEAGVTGA